MGSRGLSAKGIGKTIKNIKRWLGKPTLKPYNKDSEAYKSEDFRNYYLKDANPNRDKHLYEDDSKKSKELYNMFRRNCQRVAYAVDLRLQGYDVEALARTGDNSFATADKRLTNSFLNVYENANDKFVHITGSTSEIVSKIESMMSNKGATAIVYNYWQGGGGHAWNIVKGKERLHGIDGQVNKSFNPSKYISDADYNGVYVLVTSNGSGHLYKPTSLLSKFVKKRKTK